MYANCGARARLQAGEVRVLPHNPLRLRLSRSHRPTGFRICIFTMIFIVARASERASRRFDFRIAPLFSLSTFTPHPCFPEIAGILGSVGHATARRLRRSHCDFGAGNNPASSLCLSVSKLTGLPLLPLPSPSLSLSHFFSLSFSRSGLKESVRSCLFLYARHCSSFEEI